MPDTPGADAAIVAERVAAGVRERSHPISGGMEVSVGASVGLSVYPTDATTPARLLAAADAGMYRAKRASRAARTSGAHESPVLETPRGRVAAGPGRTPAARPDVLGAPVWEGSRPS
jgi:GGDEF domain-containing protein